ncbi:hypothetical protein GCK72_001110 [Caenorhabditis remanei]|uniref:NTF2-like domain-containing protein n=1 Tax=Caenorhabditis remanei TaxID=31234 RepID=A0A6A5HSU7_CAERE|nr:hypothetical protein GCK72_001110 [Caenorhabditis remanei]KAF1769293.1 hypothetical protein GCK72_001110 [Caenorhabditis remanei]
MNCFRILLAISAFFATASSSDISQRNVDFLKTQFGFLEKFIQYKDRDSINKLITKYFLFQTTCDGNEMGREHFIDAVFNMSSNASFHVEVLDAKYGNEQHKCIDNLNLKLKIHGFGEPVVVEGWWGIYDLETVATWVSGRPEGCRK